MNFKTISKSATRTTSRELLSKLAELRDVTMEFGGTDALREATGTNGFWDYEDTDLRDVVFFEDSRQASGLAKRIRDGELAGIEDLLTDGGTFDATSVSDGQKYGAWAPDYSAEEYKALRDEYKAADDPRAFCEANGIPVRELSGAYVAVRYIDPTSELFEA